MSDSVDDRARITDQTGRRSSVLDSALVTFARYGYRKTSMEDVAKAARISRPGLYFLFASKEALFSAAVTQTLDRDLRAIEEVLSNEGRSLKERLLKSFDLWAGRYIGPASGDIVTVIEENPHLLGPIAENAPRRFEQLILDSIAGGSEPENAQRIALTMISASIGLKHQVTTRENYLERLEDAIDLLVR